MHDIRYIKHQVAQIGLFLTHIHARCTLGGAYFLHEYAPHEVGMNR